MTPHELDTIRRLRAELELKDDRLADLTRENELLRELVEQRQPVASTIPGWAGDDTE